MSHPDPVPDHAPDLGRRQSHRPVVLVIRDGWGLNPHRQQAAFDAIALARTPVADALTRDWPTTLIRTSGEDVGLPITVSGPTMGNSEVGHQNIGAGRIVDQELMRITRAIRDGGFFANDALRGAFAHADATGGRVHLLGLVSDGMVHSDLAHLLALLELARRVDFPGDRVIVHAFTDGRDTAPSSGLGHVGRVAAEIDRLGVGRLGSIMGRFWAMDRDHRWERVQRAYDCLVGRGGSVADGWRTAFEHAYAHPPDAGRRGDEFIVPVRLPDFAPIADGDAVIFFNFRGDRPRELTKAFMFDDDAWAGVASGGFDRGVRPSDLRFVTMTAYEEGLPVEVAFPKPPKMNDILGQVIADADLTQFRCAETEKFPHVTFFFNDYREEPFPGERREIVPSPRDVSTYDQKPEMSAEGVCAAVLRRLDASDCEALIVVNFANGDMVGHTGNLEATIRAIEVVDACVGRIVDATLKRGGALIVTADHGNAEQMWDVENDCPHTAHTNYDVPCIVIAAELKGRTVREGGRLADLAPTVLELMGLPKPEAMTGRSLVAGELTVRVRSCSDPASLTKPPSPPRTS